LCWYCRSSIEIYPSDERLPELLRLHYSLDVSRDHLEIIEAERKQIEVEAQREHDLAALKQDPVLKRAYSHSLQSIWGTHTTSEQVRPLKPRRLANPLKRS